ncbi:hypothetical protein [Nocardioides nanhaiensis]|uniref:Uncharacterized protein n=1 Tax=Nocardioides nanhaiensis TaxID=1476871 RepID=A0ABP8WID5_9ACTN
MGGGVTAVAVGSGGDDGEPSSQQDTGAPDPDSEDTSETGVDPGEPEQADPVEEPERITLGPNDYLSPCQLVTLDDVTTIFGRLGPRGYVRQQIIEESMSPAVFRRETDTLSRAIDTTCTYNFGDDDVTSLTVRVDQHRSAREAAARKRYTARLGSGAELRKIKREVTLEGFEWLIDATEELAEDGGGVPVRGDDSLLYIAGRGSYLTQARNAAVSFEYGPLSFDPGPLSERERRFQDPRMLRLARLVARRVADPDLPQDRGPSNPDGREEFAPGVPHVDACAVLSAAFHEALTGKRPDPGAETSSLPVDTAARKRQGTTAISRTGRNECSRRTSGVGEGANRTTGADSTLVVQYARTPEEGETLLEEVIINRYFDEEDEARFTVRDLIASRLVTPQTIEGVDTMYLFDSEASTGKENRSLAAFVRVGSRVFTITGFRPSKDSLDLKYPTVQGFRDAAEVLAAELPEISPETPVDASPQAAEPEDPEEQPSSADQ